ncbi:MAG: TM2 domain-containing protein [Candidatus Heimdallarchaeota archaeon]
MSEFKSTLKPYDLAILQSKLKLGTNGLLLGIVFLAINSFIILLKLITYMIGAPSTYIFGWISIATGLLVLIPFVILFVSFINIKQYMPIYNQKKFSAVYVLLIISVILKTISLIFTFIVFLIVAKAIPPLYSVINPISQNVSYLANFTFMQEGTLFGNLSTIGIFCLNIPFVVNMFIITIAFVLFGQILNQNKVRFENKTRVLYSTFVMIGVAALNFILYFIPFIDHIFTPMYTIMHLLFALVSLAVYAELFVIFKKLTPEMFDPSRDIPGVTSPQKEEVLSDKSIPTITDRITDVSDKDKTMVLLLCFLVGGLGVHRFYVGKMTSGILYLCTGGLFGIGTIYDLVMIFTDKFTDVDEKLVTDKSIKSAASEQLPPPPQQTPATQQVHPVMQKAVTKAVEDTLINELTEKISFMSPGEVLSLQDIANYYKCDVAAVENALKKLLEHGTIFGSLNPFNGTFTIK